MGVPIYTTPTFTLTFSEQTLDLTQAQSVYVTFRAGRCFLTKSGDEITVSEKSIFVPLSQEDTARFETGKVHIQANWIVGGKRAASEIVEYDITGNLLPKVVE